MNVTLDDRLARFSIHSGQVVLIDPLALDGLRPQLIEIGAAPRTEQPALLRVLAGRGLRIGLCSTTDSRPGEYEVGVDSFEAAPSSSDDGVFDVDSGTVVLIDLALLSVVARALTWDRYDEFLRSPAGDFSILEAINAEVGREGFAVVFSDSNHSFSGDGAFRLLSGEPTRVG